MHTSHTVTRATLAALLAGILFLLGSGPTASAQDYQDWKFTHPKPQVNLLRKHQMIDANNWVAVGANGTFMRTTDAGANWYFHHQAGLPANNALQIGQNYDVLFVSPTNGIVVGDRGFVGKTLDGGVTFTSVPSGVPTTQRCQSISFADANTGYVAAGAASGSAGTIIKTTDGGSTWTTVYTTTNPVTSLVAIDAMVVHAVLQNGGVVNTIDGGLSWSTPVPGTAGSSTLGMSFLDSMTGFVVGSTGQISKSTDGGATWAPLPSPQTNFAFFQMKIISATEIYAVGAPDFLYKSTDLGSTWTPLPIIPVAGPSDTFIWYSLEKQGSLLTMSGDFGVIAQSTDGGASWTSNNFILTTALMFDIQEVPKTSTVVAVGRQRTSMQRQVLRSTDMGDSWSAINVPVATDLQAVSFVDSQVGYASGTNSQVVKTTDGGLTWAPVTRPHVNNYTLQALEFIDANTGWVFVNFANVTGGNIFKTTDGGTTWTQQTTGTTDQIASCDMVDANVGYITLNSSSRPIYKTTDGGTTWTPVTTPFTGQIKKVRAVDANLVYIGTSSGTNRVGKSTDGGATWTQIALPATIDVTSLDFKDANTGYVCGNSTTAICKTTDGGATWSFQNAHLGTLVRVYAGPSGTAWALGINASILRAVAPNQLTLTTAVSRKTHGGAGDFDVSLPLTGEPGVECRSSGGNHTLVFTASNDLVSGNAAVTSGVGTVSGSPTFSGNTMTVELTGVSDVQRITVTLSGVTDVNAQVLPDTPVSVNMLIGDTTGNKTVNASDIAQTKLQSGQAVTASNFREDVTVSGTINGSDISLVKSNSGASVP